MSTVESILELLNKWPKWKRVTEAPERIDDLARRLAALERKITRAPGDACPGCGASEYRAVSSRPHPVMGEAGVVERLMRCGECGFEEKKTVTARDQ